MKARSKQTLLVVDANNWAHSAYHAHRNLSFRGRGTGVIYGMPAMVKSLIWQNQIDTVVLVWDGDRSKHRKALLPNYKGHREEAQRYTFDRTDFLKQKAVVQKMFYYLGVPQICNPTQEADDMIYRVVKVAKKKWGQVVIGSNDKDFHQLITEDRKVVCWNSHKKDEINDLSCKKYYGYTPEQFLDYHTFVGDKSDDIPGYSGVGEKKAKQFLEFFGSIDNYFEMRWGPLGIQDEPFKVDPDKLRKAHKLANSLMNLPLYYERYKDELNIVWLFGKSKPKLQKEKFYTLCKKYGIQRLTNSSSFMEQFVDLKLNNG